MRIMKKLFPLLLIFCLLLTAVSPAFTASAETVYYPNVHLRGNGAEIIDENGNVVYDFDVSMDQVKAIAKRVLPLLLKNDLDAYYRAFGEEMSKLYDRALLDENGDPKYGTNISAEKLRDNEVAMTQNRVGQDGRYATSAYTFWYDWRLDPLKTAEDLDAYIDGVLAATGKDKINLNSACLGSTILLAYLSRYGADKLNAIGFQHAVGFGCELVDETFSGKINIDADAAARFEGDYFVAGLLKENEILKTFLDETIALLQASGDLDRLTTLFMHGLYDKLYEGLAPELALASFATWPSYWSMVTAEHYQSTKTFIFGQPGSERYTRYAGLIEKLDNYDAAVRQQIVPLIATAKENGAKLVIVARYGLQMPPLYESADETGDVWVSVRYASLGATASKVNETLTDAYIGRRTALGFGKYISPDRMIDASTCAFPDNTWFIKGAIHNDPVLGVDTLYDNVFDVTEDVTVATNAAYPQFLVYDRATTRMSPMTEENMHTESFPVDAEEPGFFERVKTFFQHLIPWFRSLFALLKTLG